MYPETAFKQLGGASMTGARSPGRRRMQPDAMALEALTDSRLCLGTMLMGGRTPAAEAHAMLDEFLDAGHNFIDTADVYGDGVAESTLKPWLGRRRDQVVVTTKVRFGVSDPGGDGLAPERIHAACDASLRRLGIDTIDLYEVHAPDSRVPLHDTLEALDQLVRAGKVRALGVSNFPAWLLAWALHTQDAEGWAPFVAVQAQYSLVERSAELDLLPLCRSTGLSLTPWGPLGGGFLTGRLTADSGPEPGSRLAEAPDDAEEALHRRATVRNFELVEAVRAVAAELGATVPQVAIAWLMHQRGVRAPILGPRTLAQLHDLLPAAELSLGEEHLRRLGSHTPPPVIYPHRMLAGQRATDPEQPLRSRAHVRAAS
jgi:aryl-alcohol dehydrogenase-like predicted oxidoreductase